MQVSGAATTKVDLNSPDCTTILKPETAENKSILILILVSWASVCFEHVTLQRMAKELVADKYT